MEKAKLKRVAIVVLAVLLLLIVAVGGIAVGLYWQKLDLLQYGDGTVATNEDVDEVDDTSSDVQDSTSDDIALDYEEPEQLVSEEVVENLADEEQEIVAPANATIKVEDVVNILLIGTDESTRAFTNNANADCMIILSINKKANTVKLVSIERGTGVPISIGQYAGEYEWINNMVRKGGPGFLQKTIAECFRVDLLGYIRVNPTIFIEIVDACGGIDITLTEAEAEVLEMNVGKNHMDGKAAERFARLRSIDSDWSRIGRQRTVIQAALTKAKGMSLSEINSMLDKVLPLVQTNLSKTQITELVLQVPKVAGKTASQLTLPAEGTYSIMQNKYGKNMFSVDFDKNVEILQDFLYS